MPTILRSGDALNVVPAAGELVFDIRADRLEALRGVLDLIPPEQGGARIEAAMQREWPGMDARASTAAVLAAATERLGRAIVPAQRGGASDASHFAAAGIAVTIDGLGPRGGHAHAPDEFVDLTSLLRGHKWHSLSQMPFSARRRVTNGQEIATLPRNQ